MKSIVFWDVTTRRHILEDDTLQEFHSLRFSPNIMEIVTLKNRKWMGHIAIRNEWA
jgi:hypothetical protein